MTKLKLNRFSFFIIANLILSFLYVIINNFKKFSFINASFTISMFYLIIGLLFFVGEKGFFNLTLYSFNKLNQQIQKKRGLLTEPEISIDEYVNKKYSFKNTSALLSSGILISVFTLVISIML